MLTNIVILLSSLVLWLLYIKILATKRVAFIVDKKVALCK